MVGGLHEQLGLEAIQKVVAVVETGSADGNIIGGFRVQSGELAKLAKQSRDNLRFLATLERHFLVSFQGQGQQILLG